MDPEKAPSIFDLKTRFEPTAPYVSTGPGGIPINEAPLAGQTVPKSILDLREHFLPDNLSASQQETGLIRRARTHREGKSADVPDSTDFGSIQESPSSSLDKTSRIALAKDMAMAGRLGLETVGGALGIQSGGMLVAPAVKKVGTKVAAKLAAKRLAAKDRLTKAAMVAGGEASGSLLAETFDPSEHPLRRARDVAAFAFLSDFAASKLSSGYERIRKGGSTMTPGARSAVRLLGDDAMLTPGRISELTSIDLGENFLENLLTSSGLITKTNRAANLKAKELIDNFISKFTRGASREQVDLLVADVVQQRRASFDAIAQGMYKEVDKVAPSGVSTERMIATRNKLARELNTAGLDSSSVDQIIIGIDKTVGVKPALRGRKASPVIDSDIFLRPAQPGDKAFIPGAETQAEVEDRIAEEFISFEKAATMRSDAINASPSATDVSGGTKLSGASRRTTQAFDTAMAAAAAEAGTEVLDVWRSANKFFKDGHEAFNAPAMKRLAIAEPDAMLRAIFQGDAPQQMREFRKLVLGGVGADENTARTIRSSAQRVLRNPNASHVDIQVAKLRLKDVDNGELAWNTMLGQFMKNIVNGADTGAGLSVAGTKAHRTVVGSKVIDRISDVGDDTLREMFPKQSQRRMFERFARISEIAQAGTGLGTGTFAVQMVQAGAFFELVTQGFSGRTAMILAAPAVAGQLIFNKSFVNWMTIGSRHPATSKRGLEAFRNMIIIARKAGAKIIGPDGETVPEPPETNLSKNLKDFIGVTSQRGQR